MRQGRCLGSVSRASGWWIGDWVRYGSAKYGEKYEEAAKITGYDVHSLMNMAYVASRFEISRRREKLSFSHHGELAALPPDEQERWLDRIEREELSVHALRAKLKRSTRTLGSARPAVVAEVNRSSSDSEVVCPECGHHFRPHARRRAAKASERRG